MGLDTVELVMAFEDAFDVDFPDEVAEGLVTVRDVIDYIYSKVEHSDTKLCLSQRAFHRLRRLMQETLGIERGRIRPATTWETLLPEEQRRELWQRLQVATGAKKWPPLTRSAEAERLLLAFIIGSAATAFVAAPSYKVPVALVVAWLAGWLASRATKHWKVYFEPRNATVGQTVEFLTADLPTAWRPIGTGWTREQVRAVVRQITIEHLNVYPSFDDDASFVDDLGAD